MLPSSAEMQLVRDRACGTVFSGEAARPGPGWLSLKEPF